MQGTRSGRGRRDGQRDKLNGCFFVKVKFGKDESKCFSCDRSGRPAGEIRGARFCGPVTLPNIPKTKKRVCLITYKERQKSK